MLFYTFFALQPRLQHLIDTLFLKLARIQIVIVPFGGHELFVAAGFYNFTVFDDQNDIRLRIVERR